MTSKNLKVTLQVRGFTKVGRRDGMLSPESRRPRRTAEWLTVGRFPVLYHDSKVVLVRQMNSHSLYRPNGNPVMVSYSMSHPAVQRLPKRCGSWRIHPVSVRKLQESK